MYRARLSVGLVLVALAGCSDRAPGQRSLSPTSECTRETGCVQVALTGFQGEAVELQMNEEIVFRGMPQTPDWSTELSATTEFRTADLKHIRLTINQDVVYDQPVSGASVRTIYVQPRRPFVTLTSHSSPLLD